jgi:hypothetical protein
LFPDLINIAGLLQPERVPGDIVRKPRPGADRRWARRAAEPPMREAVSVRRDAIFGHLCRRIGAAVRVLV